MTPSRRPLAGQAPVRYQIPTHLSVPDKITLPLLGFTLSVTSRQGLILLVGWNMTFNLWQVLAFLNAYGAAGQGLRIALAGSLALLALLFALVRIAERHLEEWLVVLLHYATSPSVFVWQPLPPVPSPSHEQRTPSSDRHRQHEKIQHRPMKGTQV
jgi:hypothetical protein